MSEDDGVQEEIDVSSPRGALAVRLAEVVQHRWSAEVRAIGVYGSLAHGDDGDHSDVNLLVVTYRPDAGPSRIRRRVDGIPVDLQVVTGEAGLRRARELTPRWPLIADRYLTTRSPHDPSRWFAEQRDAHLSRLAESRPAEFSGLARHHWALAAGAHQRAVHLAEWYDTDSALVLLAEARMHAALVIGFLTRTYFRNPADAAKRTGMAAVDMQELGAVLKSQAEELAARGRPVDGTLTALFD